MHATRVRPAPRRVGAVLRMCVIVIVPATNLLLRRSWRNLERIPASGPAILVLNHVSYADPFVVARAVWDSGRVPRFLAKDSLFAVAVVGTILRGAGQIPVHRGGGVTPRSLEAAVQALRRGEVVVIYPEGTVTRDGDFWPMTAKTGIARLIREAPGVPVIPVGQWGAQHAVDVYRRRFRLLARTRVVVSVGEPVDVALDRRFPDTAQELRTLTDVVMHAVREQVAQIRGLPAPALFFPRPIALVDEHGPAA